MSALSFHQEFAPNVARTLSVLVLDDDRFDRKRISRWIKASCKGAVDLVEAADLGTFSQLVLDHRPDLIFMDYQLADGDGVDAMEIYANSCGNPGAYMVMVSGCDAPEKERRAMMCGCDRFIDKSDLTLHSVMQFLDELRGVSNAASATPHPKLRSMDYWVARARRRAPVVEKNNAKIVSPGIEVEIGINERLFPYEPDVWNSDWAGARAFLNEFSNRDEIEFVKRPTKSRKIRRDDA